MNKTKYFCSRTHSGSQKLHSGIHYLLSRISNPEYLEIKIHVSETPILKEYLFFSIGNLYFGIDDPETWGAVIKKRKFHLSYSFSYVLHLSEPSQSQTTSNTGHHE